MTSTGTMHWQTYVNNTSNGEGHLIDFTFTSAAMSSGVNGAFAGSHADAADRGKEKQYTREFPDLTTDSSPISFVSLSMERNGSWSAGTRAYWRNRIDVAHRRLQAAMEFKGVGCSSVEARETKGQVSALHCLEATTGSSREFLHSRLSPAQPTTGRQCCGGAATSMRINQV